MRIDKPLLLVFPHNLLSHYLRCIVLIRELSLYYHVLVLDSQEYRDFLRKEGLHTFTCSSLDASEMNRQFGSASFDWINTNSLSAVLEDQVRVIREFQPDLVLGDASFTLKMAAEITGVPYISLINGYMSKYYAEVRLPSRSFPGYQLIKQLPHHLLLPLIRYGEGLTFRLIHEPFNRIRKRYHIEKRQQLLDELEGDINLICDDPVLFPQEGLPENYFNVGPLFYKSTTAAEMSVAGIDEKKKTICVSMGSTGDWGKMNFLNNEYFHQYNLVVAGDSERRIQGPSVIHVPFFNAESIFPRCILFICHGGNGSTYQALSHGVPVVCLTTHMEQDWNVQALEKQGLACSLNHLETDGEIIRTTDKWLRKKTEAVYHEASHRISQQVEALPMIVEQVVTFASNNFLAQSADLRRAF